MIFNLGIIITIFILYIIIKSNKMIKKEKADSIFLFIIFTILFVIIGMREFTMGNDTPTYISFFKTCSLIKWDMIRFDGYYEGGYIILNILISLISENTRFFILSMAFLFTYPVYYFIKKNSDNYLLSIIMYICLLLFYNSMSMMRQFCAVIIILSSFKFVKQKKLIPFILSILLASLFHSSVWVALIIYPAFHTKHNLKNVIIIIIVTILSTIFLEPIINIICEIIGRKNYYSDRLGSERISNMLYTFTYLIMYLVSVYFINKNKNSVTNKTNFYLYSLLLASAVNFIAINMNILARAALYFNIFSIIAFPNIINQNIKNYYNKKVLYVTVTICLILYSSTIIKLRPEWNTAFNYKSCIIKNVGDICE